MGACARAGAARTTAYLDGDWRFSLTADAQPPSGAGAACAAAGCARGTADGAWRALALPHDFVVEGNFSESADAAHGYLPYASAWYRRHVSLPADFSAARLELELQGVATQSVVFLNGVCLGGHKSGYTLQRYVLDNAVLDFGAGSDNVLAVYADGTHPDGWWYDGGGIHRHVILTAIATPGPFIAPFGVYPPSSPTGAISWSADGAPFADSELLPSVTLGNSAAAPQTVAVALTVVDADGKVAASASGGGSVPANGTLVWTPSAPVALPHAALWHLVAPPLRPALYTLAAVVSVGGAPVDALNVTFGVRSAVFDKDTGFHLNGVATKILGFSNHQDAAAVGVAVPDHMQWHRVAQLKSIGANGWRTAHNPPNPALLDAFDELGFLAWDEDHRNGEDGETPLLVLRDRHHPSVIIWSICNEILCDSQNPLADANRIRQLMHSLDPLGQRPVSANSRDGQPLPIGPTSPLDLQGVDYTTEQYDAYHARNPALPMVSSESSSAYSDRGEWVTTEYHVSPYNEHPNWGEDAEAAWGGINVSASQGIMTRPFVAGGFTCVYSRLPGIIPALIARQRAPHPTPIHISYKTLPRNRRNRPSLFQGRATTTAARKRRSPGRPCRRTSALLTAPPSRRTAPSTISPFSRARPWFTSSRTGPSRPAPPCLPSGFTRTATRPRPLSMASPSAASPCRGSRTPSGRASPLSPAR